MADNVRAGDVAPGATIGASVVGGAATAWLALGVSGTADGDLSMWSDPFVLGVALLAGTILGVIVGPLLTVLWLRRVPPWIAALGVAAGMLAGFTVGGLLARPLPYLWVGTTALGVGAATWLLRRRYARSAATAADSRAVVADA
jgi:F0F1-type ATP synthase assembly protein I